MDTVLAPCAAPPGGDVALAKSGSGMDEQRRIRRDRLRWHCRRALLELDIIFQRFWARSGYELDDATAATLERLLEMEDHDLWELISGRATTDDPQLEALVASLRSLGAADGRC